MNLTVLQQRDGIHGPAGIVVLVAADGQSQKHLVRMKAGIFASQIIHLQLLDGLERLYRRYLTADGPQAVRKEKLIANIKYIEEARRDLLANVNYKYAIRNLILKLGG